MLARLRAPKWGSALSINLWQHLLAAQLYLHQLEDTAGADLAPPGVDRVLKSKGCRSAIMFGDQLSPQECGQLVQQLQGTQQCFSCAHGRPTMAPLLYLGALAAVAGSRLENRRELAAAAAAAAAVASKRRGSGGSFGGETGKPAGAKHGRLTVAGLQRAITMR
jgi:hypothetical protein